MPTVGAVLSAVSVLDGPAPAAALPAASLAVPSPMLIPSVPSPVIPLMRTVGVDVEPFSTLTLPFEVPVLFRVTFADNRLIVLAPV